MNHILIRLNEIQLNCQQNLEEKVNKFPTWVFNKINRRQASVVVVNGGYWHAYWGKAKENV